MDFVLFGIQGSGKGTQGKILAEQLDSAYFEMGGELRRLAAEKSELGRKVKSIIEAGNLVPTEVVMEIVENFAHRAEAKNQTAGGSIIWDGIPRNKEQNDRFEALLKKLGRPYKGIYFELSREDAENRLLNRRLCEKCKTVYPAFYRAKKCDRKVAPSGALLSSLAAARPCGGALVTRADDNENSIRRRLELFFQETLPVAENWRAENRLITVNGSGSIESVTENLKKALP